MQPEGRAGDERGRFCTSRPTLYGMKAVDVLERVHGVEDALFGVGAHARRQRRLHQDGVGASSAFSRATTASASSSAGGRGSRNELGPAAGLAGGLHLVADVDLRRRVVADQDDAQAWRAAVRGR